MDEDDASQEQRKHKQDVEQCRNARGCSHQRDVFLDVSVHDEIYGGSDSHTSSKQSEHGEAENTANDTLDVADGVLVLAIPGPLPRLLLPMFVSSPLFLLQEDGHGISVHIRVFAWRYVR